MQSNVHQKYLTIFFFVINPRCACYVEILLLRGLGGSQQSNEKAIETVVSIHDLFSRKSYMLIKIDV